MARKGFAKTVDRDLGAAKVRSAIVELKAEPYVKVGILDSAGEHKDADGLTVVDVAIFNEFGTSRAPERPFLRTSAAELMPIISRLHEKLLAAIVLGKTTVDKGLDLVGLTAQAHIKRVIRDWTTPPNAPSTILAKARKSGRKKLAAARGAGPKEYAAALAAYDNPLQDTDQMLNSVDYIKARK